MSHTAGVRYMACSNGVGCDRTCICMCLLIWKPARKIALVQHKVNEGLPAQILESPIPRDHMVVV